MYKIPETFIDFISPECNRKEFIQKYLEENGVESAVISLEGKNHIYVKFPQEQYNSMFRIKTVIAHYDRIGIGANDNSAAVFCLMEWAVKLSKEKRFHNIRLIFTDGEELGENGIEEQGAFPLAQVFKRLGILNDDIFVFDCMGRGDVPVLTQTFLPPKAPKKFINSFNSLEQRAQNLLYSSSGGKWFCLPCNYSDNASFIANAIPAVAITLLPSLEINEVLQGNQPETWRLLHTEKDDILSLTPSSFELFHKILLKLAEMNTMI